MFVRVIEGIAGLVVAWMTLRDVFYTVAVPGSTRGLLRVSRRLVRLALPLGRRGGRHGIPVNFAPIVLVGSFATWMFLLVLGFGLILHALAGSFEPPLDGFGHALYVAGGAMGTIGFGTADARGLARGVVVVAGFCGLAVMTLAVTYLLEVQSNIAQRDVGVLKLTTTAGKPPSALALLERYALLACHDETPRVLRDGRQWCATVLQSHATHPWLVYFRSVGTASGWPAALGALMDLALIAQWLLDDRALRGPAVLAGEEAHRLACEVVGLLRLDVPARAVLREEAQRLCERLVAAGYRLREDRDLDGFIAAREEHASRIEALARHLGTAPSPLLAASGG
jgi:hypothetical protein